MIVSSAIAIHSFGKWTINSYIIKADYMQASVFLPRTHYFKQFQKLVFRNCAWEPAFLKASQF